MQITRFWPQALILPLVSQDESIIYCILVLPFLQGAEEGVHWGLGTYGLWAFFGPAWVWIGPTRQFSLDDTHLPHTCRLLLRQVKGNSRCGCQCKIGSLKMHSWLCIGKECLLGSAALLSHPQGTPEHSNSHQKAELGSQGLSADWCWLEISCAIELCMGNSAVGWSSKGLVKSQAGCFANPLFIAKSPAWGFEAVTISWEAALQNTTQASLLFIYV